MHDARARTRSLQDEIIAQIAGIDRQIAGLTAEREVLTRTLTRVRNDEVAQREVNRKNSINRVILEDAVLVILKFYKTPISLSKLMAEAKYTVPSLNPNTFRSALHRMKERGLVESPSRGKWSLPPPSQA